jgi:hypothetical protein
VFDAGAHTIQLYVNASSQGSVSHTALNTWNATGALQAGRSWWNNAYADWWYGKLDSVRVYQRVLSSSDVTSLYNDTDPAAPFTEAPMTAGITGALQGAQQGQQATTAVAFAGNGYAYSNNSIINPTSFTIECWFRTTSTTGGVILGLASAQTGNPAQFDRTVYLDSGNRLTFGTWPAASALTVRSTSTYNDGTWHHVAASLGAAGARLYVDGALVASDATITTAGNYTGYWRIGGDGLTSWPNNPTTGYLTGTIDEAAVYSTQLSKQQISWHYNANH